MKMNKCGVYRLIVEGTDYTYVGSSIDIARRWSHYVAQFKAGKHYYKELQDHYNFIKYEILEECTENELEERENYWILFLKKADWNVINKQEKATRKSRVKDTCSMKLAQKGSKNGNARLTIEDVHEIKKLLAEGELKQKQIAEMYNVSQTLIYNIKTGKRWGHVDEKSSFLFA